MVTIDDLREQYKVDGVSCVEVVEKSIDCILKINPNGAVTVNDVLHELFLAEQISFSELEKLTKYATQKYEGFVER